MLYFQQLFFHITMLDYDRNEPFQKNKEVEMYILEKW